MLRFTLQSRLRSGSEMEGDSVTTVVAVESVELVIPLQFVETVGLALRPYRAAENSLMWSIQLRWRKIPTIGKVYDKQLTLQPSLYSVSALWFGTVHSGLDMEGSWRFRHNLWQWEL